MVRVFDPQGGPIRSMGRKGGGRGEFTRPIALRVDSSGAVLVLDFGKQTWTRFTSDGTAADGEPIADLGALGWQLSWTDAGLVTHFRRGYRTDADSVFDGVHLMSATDTTVLGGVASKRSEEQIYHECLMMIPLPPVFEHELVWDASGNRTAVNDELSYVIKVFDGKTLKMRVTRQIKPEIMDADDAAASLKGQTHYKTPEGQDCEIDPAKMVEQRGFESVLQAISGIAVAPDGTLWVRRARMHPDDTPAIDMINPDGEYIGTLPEGSPYPLAFDLQGRPVILAKDDLDVEQIVIYEIKKE